MLITESLFLLLRREDGKAESVMAQNTYGLAAAAVTDLVLARRITLSDDKDPRVTVLVPGPVGHPALDVAMERVEHRDSKKLSALVTDWKMTLEEPIARALAAAGIVRIEEKRVLGLVPPKYPVLDAEPERRVRDRLRTVLAGGTPEPADSTLLAILQGLGIAHTVLADEAGSLGKMELKARIEEVSTEVQAGAAVAKAVEAMNVAIMTAVIVPAVIGGGASG